MACAKEVFCGLVCSGRHFFFFMQWQNNSATGQISGVVPFGAFWGVGGAQGGTSGTKFYRCGDLS
jgi:hypothetical protein